MLQLMIKSTEPKMRGRLNALALALILVLSSSISSLPAIASAQLESALNCQGGSGLCQNAEDRHIEAMFKRYHAGHLSFQEIEDFIFELETMGIPYQAAGILNSELNAARHPVTGLEYMKLNDLYLKAREDELALAAIETAIQKISHEDPNYPQLIELAKAQKQALLENNPIYIKTQIYENSLLRDLEEHQLKKNCFQKFKQTYRVHGPINVGSKCQKYKPEYSKRYSVVIK